MDHRSMHTAQPPKPYGAAELKQIQPRAQLMSLLFSAILLQSIAFLGSWWWSHETNVADPPSRLRPDTISYWVLQDPPLWPRDVPAPPKRGSLVPKLGTPVPVEDPVLDTSAHFPTVEELRRTGTDEGTDPGVVVRDEPVVVEDPEPAAYVVREVEPVVAVRVDPPYPPVALRAGLEGNVYVRVWVDTRGLVRKAEVLKSDGAVFDDVALEAVRRWVFTPALMQNRPVAVWVTIPIRFRLAPRSLN